jgi:hypothetical protein
MIGIHREADDRLVALIELLAPWHTGGHDGWPSLRRQAFGRLLLRLGVSATGRRSALSLRSTGGEEERIATVAVGTPLPDMPLILTPDTCVTVPLEPTYLAAWDDMPSRWRRELEGAGT